MNALPDSGRRVEVSTGAVRERAPGKGRYDLISPIVTGRLARHMEAGAIKYTPEGGPDGGRNWEKGLPLSWYVDGAKRHLDQYLEGRRDEDHLAAVLWNAHGLIHTEEMISRGVLPRELNDLPPAYKRPDSYFPDDSPEPTTPDWQRERYAHLDGRQCRNRNNVGDWEIEFPSKEESGVLEGTWCTRWHGEVDPSNV